MTNTLKSAALAQAVSAVELALAVWGVEVEDLGTGYRYYMDYCGERVLQAVWKGQQKEFVRPADNTTWEMDALIEAHVALNK